MSALRRKPFALGPILVLCLLFGTAQAGVFVGEATRQRGHESTTTSLDTNHYPSPPPTVPRRADEVGEKSPFTLRMPSVVKSFFVYDGKSGNYLLVTTVDGRKVGVPIAYTPAQYRAYLQRQEGTDYYRARAREEAQTEGKRQFNPFDFGFELGPAEKIFGPGGVKLKTQGSAEVLLGVKSNATDNPSIPINARRHTFLDFDEKIQASVQASVGSKLNFNLNYNTETTFDFDTKRLKLAYDGEEDDIVKLVEAGNVSLRPRNSLIQGGASLFGLHTKLQFGKLDVDFVVSQQEAETKRVSTEGGVQTTPFEISANNYDEGRHFFLSHYFYHQYDKALSTLPFVSSGVVINRLEVWVTNKRGNFEEARNIVAFADLGEPQQIFNPHVSATGSTGGLPANSANTLYQTLLGMPDLRQVDRVTQVLQGQFEGGKEYAKLESARRLSQAEYTFNPVLGYISIHNKLAADEVIGVAFEYTYQGKVYQVGEFSTDRTERPAENLYLKLVKGTAMSPAAPYWRLMMRNVYSLGTNVQQLQRERFRLDIYYRSDSTGTAFPYITEGNIANKLLVAALGMDKLDSRGEAFPDGVFDYLEGYTVDAARGRIIFNTVEPFGRTLRQAIGDNSIADKYVYQEIYDTTRVAAKQVAEKDKFVLRGEYKASTSGQISLGAMNVTPGSVRVIAGGVELTENVDYTVNYTMGTVTILNESILQSGTRVDVSLENRGFLNLQRKTMLGLDLNYHFTPNFTLGGTVMYLSEMPLTSKTSIGDESMRNLLWGANLSYQTKSQILTNILDKIPLLDLTTPSEIQVNAEFAHLIPGHYESKYAKGYSYIDDFEQSQSNIDLMSPYAWMPASTPYQDPGSGPVLFPEAALTNDLRYGSRRALLSWFYIDPLFNRKGTSSYTPSYIRNDADYLSNHYSREISMQELFPYRDYSQTQLSYLQTLNLAYYPKERGPYNLSTSNLNPDGTLAQAEQNWAGIMRKVDQSDFEAANIEYIEFWLMDPFIYHQGENLSGEMYLNLGEISEEVLRDEMKFFENGMPVNDDPAATKETIWGKVPIRQGTGYAFDNAPGARAKQDVGFNGLTNEEEKQWPAYVNYLTELRNRVSADVQSSWQEDPKSPLNDPAGDDFVHYRDARYDSRKAQILDRYKYYNGTQGNSAEATDSNDPYSISSRVVPDVEDINQDNTLNENEKYFQYRIPLSHADLAPGKGFVVDVRPASVTLPNGKRETINWYQFKVPVKEYDRTVGGIADFKSVRFLRLYLTGFREETHLRFGSFKLVRGEWRKYERELHEPDVTPSSQGTLEVSTVNIEENGDRKPINYVLPPGVLRSLDPTQAQATRQNEQSMSLRVRSLAPADARAVYRNMSLDLRRYKRMELFAHAERLLGEDTQTSEGDLTLFLRLGSDYRNNYYEYSVPLSLTPYGTYSTDVARDRETVWPKENKIDFLFEQLTKLKVERNKQKGQGNPEADYYKRFTRPDANNPRNSLTIVGNPTLSAIKTVMIGVRNSSGQVKSAEVWVNELRLSEFQERGGWAANADVQIKLSDWGALNARGQYLSAGFGALDQSLAQRRLEDERTINFSTRLELGKFFPEKAQVSIPLYYAYNEQLITPEYNPLDADLLLKEALDAADTPVQRDSIRNHAIERTATHSLSLANMRVNIRSKNPMPYDPANFSFSYALNQTTHQTPNLVYDNRRDWQAAATYDYSPVLPPVKPFGWIKSQKNHFSQLKSYQINPLPSRISLSTNMTRNYSEQQVRNFIPGVGDIAGLPATFVQNFIWNRQLSVAWNLTTNIQGSFQSGTNARIEEPHVQVNRLLAPDDYKLWQDSVRRSVAEFGRPIHYDQRASLTWRLPISMIPYMNWINATATYTGTYNWDRGAILPNGHSLGNIIRNEMNLDGNLSLSLVSLYRSIPAIDALQKRISQSKSTTQASSRRKSPIEARPQAKPSRFTQQVTLSPDSTTLVQHKLNNKKVQVVAKDANGRTIKIKSRTKDANTIEILTKDTLTLDLAISSAREGRGSEEDRNTPSFWDYTLNTLLMLRDVNISYRYSNQLNLPGFMPLIRAAGGQGKSEAGLAPGLPFAFGFVGRDFVEQAVANGWMTSLQENVTPSTFANTQNLNIRATLEPFPECKVTLTAMRNSTLREETSYVYEGLPRTFSGNFTMTMVGLRHFFHQPSAGDGYSSPAFENFLAAQPIISGRLAEAYQAAGYDGSIGIRAYSADVLIPAFLASYAQFSPQQIKLSPFPSLLSMLPNWSITYTGLGKLPGVREYLTNLSLSHNYTATYTVGNYGSLLGWTPIGDGSLPLGVVTRTEPGESGMIGNFPSMPYDIPSVTIQEGFSPLVGMEVTFKSGVTLGSRWNKRRSMTLNVSSFQMIESSSDEITASVSYKVADVSKLLGIKRKPAKKGKQSFFTTGGGLTIRLDYSYNRSSMLIRKIQEHFTQATNGNIAQTLKFSCEYDLSRMLTLRAFYDWNKNFPLVSNASFPTRNSHAGISLRVNLTQ